MTAPTHYYFICTCGATGSAETTNKTDSGPDAKHQAACTGSVNTGTDAARLVRMFGSSDD